MPLVTDDLLLFYEPITQCHHTNKVVSKGLVGLFEFSNYLSQEVPVRNRQSFSREQLIDDHLLFPLHVGRVKPYWRPPTNTPTLE